VKSYVTTYESVGGFKAVQIWLHPAEDGLPAFWEPYETGLGAYASHEAAEVEAREWAASEGLDFVPHGPRSP
jgi:hypothetical protein